MALLRLPQLESNTKFVMPMGYLTQRTQLIEKYTMKSIILAVLVGVLGACTTPEVLTLSETHILIQH